MERERGEIFHAMETKYSAVKSSLIPFVPLILISVYQHNTTVQHNVHCIISSRKFPYLANHVLVCSIFVSLFMN